ncbi:hypothetical protein GGX14DRAFT_588873 [Mycena pura]|uniref:Uncharacterized protein n=1 Tax=Mycena pura TaxID=153505 RepID=A0AAD6USF7_9AGAR|nr:hypothetical protein GGX14DRAFT_588873 [Mycena pura]
MDKPSPLPGCKRDATFETARQLIWPDTPWSSEITEPARLTQIIYTYTEPDKQWLTINGDGDVPMSEPADAGDVPIGEPADAGDVGDNLAEVTIHEEKATFIVREEYKEFIKHALSHRSLFRCFVTGQPGIGKSSRCSGFRAHGSRRQAVFRGAIFPHVPPRLGKVCILGAGRQYLLLQRNGVQRLVDPKTVPTSFDFQRALRNSWVLIDVDQDPMPNTTYNLSPYVIWTSSPRDLRWRYFRKHFWPCERWFMKPWSAKEIMAAAFVSCFCCSSSEGGPSTAQDVSNDIGRALSGNPFAVEAQPGTEGAQPVHAVFLIVPAIVKDDGGHRLVRQNFYTEFLTPAVAEMTFALAENRMEQLQLHLSRAFDISSTRGVAGKLVEGLMHRSLRVACDFRTFSAVARQSKNRASPVPPPTVAFAAVDAMVALSDGRLVLLQTSLADTHSRDFGTMLRIIARLPNGAGVHVGDGVFYCLVGSTDFRVRNLAHTVANTLTWLQGLSEDSPKKFRFGQIHHPFCFKEVRFEVRSVENFMAGNNPTRPSLVVRVKVKVQRHHAVLYPILRLGAGMLFVKLRDSEVGSSRFKTATGGSHQSHDVQSSFDPALTQCADIFEVIMNQLQEVIAGQPLALEIFVDGGNVHIHDQESWS